MDNLSNSMMPPLNDNCNKSDICLVMLALPILTALYENLVLFLKYKML